jgi:hypothetical protein
MPSTALPVLPTRLKANTATTYTFTAFDQNAIVTSSNGSAQTLTLPADTVVNYPIGTQIQVIQLGAGAITVAAPATGSVAGTIVPATSNTAAAGDTLILTKTTANGWHCGVAVAA